ncbi:PHD finger containing protein Phf1 [Schizosaccharomyces cryophilus OY26]|uniref:PHD finger containing protein Phf1 n=1 Tax=Schizosaccharomyces cryophilus (strain OY26 / ATCC MYA-4695 / CBS 11777 / NBRC 106824 / NRRL Y48691) TaxID=653667 RepID=S9WZ33_SCHCR|nr:PHD finger containing protein Phf1 [Schizosaccharomyces cryophilus OY26]EPY49962.1 PHD finger containing protein Phf1 [Schizosaccharomyces cryophilus OY26]
MTEKYFFPNEKEYDVNDYANFHFGTENDNHASMSQKENPQNLVSDRGSNIHPSSVASTSLIPDVPSLSPNFHNLQQHVSTPYGEMAMPVPSSAGMAVVAPEGPESNVNEVPMTFNRTITQPNTSRLRDTSSRYRASNSSRKSMYNEDELDDESDLSASMMQDDFQVEGMKTKSGRKIQRPVTYNPSAASLKKRTRKADLVSLCIVCHRGHSPASNQLVFCDGCNSPYHQLCHQPPIDDLAVQIEDSEWYCMNCQYSRAKQFPLETGATSQVLGLDAQQLRAYFLSLPVPHLVDLILLYEKSFPDLRIYSPQTRENLGEIRRQVLISAERNQSTLQEKKNAKQDEVALDLPPHVPYTTEYVSRSGILYDYPTILRLAIRNVDVPSKENIFAWMSDHLPLTISFRESASDALRWMVTHGQLVRTGYLYQITSVDDFFSLRPSLLPTFQKRRKVPKVMPMSYPTDESQSLSFTVL